MIFNLGAPSHLDLWDMKPDAPKEIRGPFKPIRTKSDAFEISEILPLHAEIADKFSLVRSCHHDGAAVHDAGWQMMADRPALHGRSQLAPCRIGCQLPTGTEVETSLPLSCCRKSWAGAAAISPTVRLEASSARRTILSLSWRTPPRRTLECPIFYHRITSVPGGWNAAEKCGEIVDETVDRFEASEDARLLDENFQAAFRMMTSEQARSAFDLSKEPVKVRERYGMNRFGQCCLLARRLIENGVASSPSTRFSQSSTRSPGTIMVPSRLPRSRA